MLRAYYICTCLTRFRVVRSSGPCSGAWNMPSDTFAVEVRVEGGPSLVNYCQTRQNWLEKTVRESKHGSNARDATHNRQLNQNIMTVEGKVCSIFSSQSCSFLISCQPSCIMRLFYFSCVLVHERVFTTCQLVDVAYYDSKWLDFQVSAPIVYHTYWHGDVISGWPPDGT